MNEPSGAAASVPFGHGTRIADRGGFLDLHWKVPSYPRDDPPPGGALAFEVLADASGKQFVRAFYRSQTMDQVRELQPLSTANAPAYEYLPIPGCADACPLPKFEALVRARLASVPTLFNRSAWVAPEVVPASTNTGFPQQISSRK